MSRTSISQTTSSPSGEYIMADKKNFNYLALRGAPVDDMEFVEQFGLDPALAYTNKLNDAMLEMTYKQNIEAGTPEDKAMENKMNAMKDIKTMLASKGML